MRVTLRKVHPPVLATEAGGTHPTGMLSCYRPQTKFAKVMFLQVSVILSTGGVCVVAPGGACVVAPGGVRGCSRGRVWLLRGGECVVFPMRYGQ